MPLSCLAITTGNLNNKNLEEGLFTPQKLANAVNHSFFLSLLFISTSKYPNTLPVTQDTVLEFCLPSLLPNLKQMKNKQ